MRCGDVLYLVAQSCPTVCDPMDYSPPVHGGIHVILCPWGFSRQEYWSGLPCPPPGDLPNPGIEPRSPALQADSLPSEPHGKSQNVGISQINKFNKTRVMTKCHELCLISSIFCT